MDPSHFNDWRDMPNGQSLVGMWVPEYRQGNPHDQNLHKVKGNLVPSLLIEENHTGCLMKKKLFGGFSAVEGFEWSPTDEPGSYNIHTLAMGLDMLASINTDGKLVTLWASYEPSIDGLVVVYKRQ